MVAELGFQLSGCTETTCAAEIGRALNADEMIVGSLEKLGNMFIIAIRFVNVESVKITLAESASRECNIEELPNVVNELVKKVLYNFE